MPKQTMRFMIQRFVGWICFTFLALNLHANSSHWQTVAPGIAYQDIAPLSYPEWSHIHVFRIDLMQNHLSLRTARQLKRTYASAQTFAKKSHAMIAINGGFFESAFHPLGLRIQNHQILSRLKAVSWWGVFYIAKNKAFIKSMKEFQHNPDINMAIQSGPRLLINGEIPRLKRGVDQRTALGITNTGEVIILVTERAAMTTTELAEHMKSPALACWSAINLDGGSSTQLFAKMKDFRINVPGLTSVSDALIVTPKIHNLSTG